MADAALYNSAGEKVDEIALPDALFDVAANHDLVHQALVQLGRGDSQTLHCRVFNDLLKLDHV